MALLSFVGSFAQPNNTTGNQSTTGIGFQPKVVLFFGNTKTADGTNTTNADYMFGVAISSSDRRVTSAHVDSTAGGNSHDDSKCIQFLSNAAVLAAADFVSMDSDGFTVNWTTADATQRVINYMALGGSDLTNVKSGAYQSAAANGNQSVTGVGFQPDCLLMFETRATATAPPNSIFAANLAVFPRIGFGTNSTHRGASGISMSALIEKNYQRTNRIIVNANTPAEADLVSMDADGFTVNWLTNDTSFYVFYLALKGGKFSPGSFTQKTSTGSQAVTGVGFQPTGLLLVSDNSVASTTIGSTALLSVGAASGSSNRGTIWTGGDTTPHFNSDLNRTNALRLDTQGASVTNNAQADFTSFDSDGFTLNWGAADATAREILYLAFGQKTLGVSVSDSSTVTEFVTVKAPLAGISVFDSSAVTESVTVRITNNISVYDAPIAVDYRTNQVPNPSFEADTVANTHAANLWTHYGTVANTYDGVANSFAQYGTKSYEISQVTTSMDGGLKIQLTGLPLGATVTLSAWVKTDANVANANLVLTTSQDGLTGNNTSTNNVGANNNSRQSTSILLDVTGVNIFMGLGSFGAASLGTVFYDGIMLEVSPTSNSYIDGAQTNCNWTGTANASTSTSSFGMLTLREIDTVSVFDSSAVTESLTVSAPLAGIVVSDSSTVTESVQAALVNNLSVFDSSSVTESVTVVIPALPEIIFDSSTVTESTTVTITNTISVSDSSTVTENISVSIPGIGLVVSDSSTITESTTVEIVDLVSVFDSSTVTDAAQLQITNTLTVFDSSIVTESVSLSVPVNTSIFDTTTVTESVQVTITNSISVVDSSTVTESLSVQMPVNVVVSDSSTVTDVLSGQNFGIFLNPIDVVVYDRIGKDATLILIDGRLAYLIMEGTLPMYTMM